MQQNNKILLVEDDPSISEMVRDYLQKENYTVVCAFDGEEALHRVSRETFDLILLDLMLPKLDGIELLKAIRSKHLLPVLIMSAKDSDVDKALGLGFGADDYIAKPFSMIELSARVKAALRRAQLYSGSSQEQGSSLITLDKLEIDPDNFSVYKNGEELKLTAKEFHILKLLAVNPKKVFTKEMIYRSIWQDEYYRDENVINVHMRRLREKIEDDPSNPRYIVTLWGIGYRLGEF